MLALALLLLPAMATCPATPEILTQDLAAAESAFSSMNADGFRAASARALQDAACLTGHVEPEVAARLHRVRGMEAFLDADEAAARRAFAAARAADPTYTFPEGLLPRNHPIRVLYDGAATLAPEPVTEPPPAVGALEFDGRITRARPTGWPTLVVLLDPTGAAARSAWLTPGDPLFSYPIAGPAPLSAASAPRTAPDASQTGAHAASGLSLPLGITAAASAVAGGALYGAAWAARQRFEDPATPDDALPGLQTRTNALYYGSVGAGLLAAGSGVGAVVVRRW